MEGGLTMEKGSEWNSMRKRKKTGSDRGGKRGFEREKGKINDSIHKSNLGERKRMNGKIKNGE